jgi:hypothetical protein
MILVTRCYYPLDYIPNQLGAFKAGIQANQVCLSIAVVSTTNTLTVQHPEPKVTHWFIKKPTYARSEKPHFLSLRGATEGSDVAISST